MITIRKLGDLPPKTRLRKVSRLFRRFEYQLRGLPSPDSSSEMYDSSGPLQLPDIIYVRSLFEIVASEAKLPEPLRQRCAGYRRIDAAQTELLVRALNDAHHGIELFLGRTVADWDFFTGGELDGRMRRTAQLYLYLDDLRSPFNVGAVFRAADAFGVRGLFLSPATASPEHSRAARASMGAVSVIPWRRCEIDEAIERAAELTAQDDISDIGLFAVETGGQELSAFGFPSAGIAVIGSEELGVGPEALSHADRSAGRVSIPMSGAKGSLNVAVAAGIVLYQWWHTVATRGATLPPPRG